MSLVASKTQILVIGGGPSGTQAATCLANEGFEVTLLERDHFPRYHIGESQLSSIKPFLAFTGALPKVEEVGFRMKPGAASSPSILLGKEEGYADLIKPEPEHYAYNVGRAQFDDILLRHAQSRGVSVHEGVSTDSLQFVGDRPISASWSSSEIKESGTIAFDYLVDASGKTGIMCTRYLKNRKVNKSFKNYAIWAYYEGCGIYGEGTDRALAPLFEGLPDGSGWGGIIPLDKNYSINIIMSESAFKRGKAEAAAAGAENPVEVLFMKALKSMPGVDALVSQGKLVSEFRTAGDYSYGATRYSGPNFRVVGDAGAFIDPFFSTGVHIALASGTSAAATISSSIRKIASEEEAAAFHHSKFEAIYSRFLICVMAAYKQVQNPHEYILTTPEEKNFNNYLTVLRPILVGDYDSRSDVLNEDLAAALAFVRNIFAPKGPVPSAVRRKSLLYTALDYLRLVSPTPIKETPVPAPSLVDMDSIIQFTRPNAPYDLFKVREKYPIEKMPQPESQWSNEIIDGWTVSTVQGNFGMLKV